MACSESPVAKKCYADAKSRYGDRVYFLGIIGDQSHQTRQSGHNCGSGAELSCTDPNYAHAVDIGVTQDSVGYEIVSLLKKDPRVHYMIFKGVGHRPDHRGGSTFASAGHDHHVHVSFGCGTTFDVRPFFDVPKTMTREQFKRIMTLAKRKAAEENNRLLRVKTPRMRGEDVALVKQAVNFNVYGTGYGTGVRDAVKEFQKYWGLEQTGTVNRATWELVWFYHIAKYLGF